MACNGEWVTGRGLVGRQEAELSCASCGSLHPDTFMAWLRDGGMVTPTDKDYKAYIACPYPDPRAGERSTDVTDAGTEVTTVYGIRAKFYFEHLSAEQRDELVRLCNERKVAFDYPGHFYVLPFFCHPVNG